MYPTTDPPKRMHLLTRIRCEEVIHMTNRTPRTEAFMDRAIHTHGDAVFRLALNQLRNVTDAQDAVQETFVRLLTS